MIVPVMARLCAAITRQRRVRACLPPLVMPIVVKINRDDRPGEWAVIELQGDLESRNQGSLHSQYIGDLHYTNKDVPILIVGHHILYGKEVVLEKPFAVLEKKRHPTCSKEGRDPAEAMEVDDYEDNMPMHTEYIVKSIVKKKLLFKTRPKPIIANVPKCV